MRPTQSQFTGRRALLVEDYFINQEILQEMLKLMGITVETASNGEEALERATQKAYDVILMDIQMPKKDGYQVTREIRKEGQNIHTPIIAVTASALTGDREKCIEAGMDDYLAKPIELDQLEAMLKKHLRA
jgi:CheY-like chemotaxis protein